MKNLVLILLTAAGLVFGTVVLAGCDRSMDDINPEPISDGIYGPGFAYQSIMVAGGGTPIPEAGEDTIEPGHDAVVETDIEAVDTELEVNACSGSLEFCTRMELKGYEERYTEYCECIDAKAGPIGDTTNYCGCCYFGYDDSFPEFDASEGSDEGWSFQVTLLCEPQGYTPPGCKNY